MASRVKLGLPQDKKIILIFGHRLKAHLPILCLIREVSTHFPCLLLIVSQKDIDLLKGLEMVDMELRKESPSIERLYDYLHASDVLIIHRSPCNGVVVSSMAYQCLGSGCLILASNTNYFETMKDVVVTYSDFEEFKGNLMDILTEGEKYRASQSALEAFLESNSAKVIAMKYIDLFEIMLEEWRVRIFPQSLKPIPYPEHIDQMQPQLAIERQATNPESPFTKGTFKTGNIKVI